mmetsp:Transcript_32937/g.90948  ORF Transcript_32937/g.90948 Transcript_32937/m.90948 type:complete len:238 (-) Transcript_32937:98-811(-)
MNQGHRVNDLCSQDGRVLAVPLNLVLNAFDSALGPALGVEGVLRVILPQGLAQQQLGLRVLLAWVPKAFLGPRDKVAHPPLELIEVQEVAKAEAVANGLRGVAGPDAALGGANGAGTLLSLENAIDDLVAVEENMCSCGDVNPLYGTRVKVLQVLQLPHERRNVDHDTIADEILARLVDHPTWQQVEGILLPVDQEGVPGIGAAVETRAELHFLREDVHKLALAFISPLGPKDYAEL